MRYWLFADCDYYASGGVSGLRGRFDSESDAVARLRELIAYDPSDVEWYQIVDVHDGRVVRHYNGGGYGTDGRITCPFVELAPEDSGDSVLIPD